MDPQVVEAVKLKPISTDRTAKPDIVEVEESNNIEVSRALLEAKALLAIYKLIWNMGRRSTRTSTRSPPYP